MVGPNFMPTFKVHLEHLQEYISIDSPKIKQYTD